MKTMMTIGAALLAAAPAQATTLLDVGGTQDQTYTVSRGTAVAVAFSLTQAAKDVSIKAPILCLGCSGGVYFNKALIGPTSGLGNTLAAHAFNATSTQPYFTFASLDPGTYFLILSIDAASTGSAFWTGASQISVSGQGAARGFDFAATELATYVPKSDFRVKFGLGLNYTVSASAVPEPASWFMMIVGFGLVGLCVRKTRVRIGLAR